jgi:hypothetical protein
LAFGVDSASVRLLTPILLKIFATWRMTVFWVMNSVSAISRLDLPDASSFSFSAPSAIEK